MANNNANNNGQLNLTEEKQRMLAKAAATGYSISGYLPVSSEWKLTEAQIKDIIMRITRQYLDDAKTVTLMVDHRSGAIYAYVTIPANSKHVTSHKLNNSDSAIKRSMKEYSQQMKEFMNKFCEKNNQRLLPGERNNSVLGIQVEIPKFMRIEFDENGYEYGKQIGDRFKRRTKIKLYPNFLRPKDGVNGNFGAFNFMRVIKTIEGDVDKDDWRPKRSYTVR